MKVGWDEMGWGGVGEWVGLWPQQQQLFAATNGEASRRFSIIYWNNLTRTTVPSHMPSRPKFFPKVAPISSPAITDPRTCGFVICAKNKLY